MKTYSALGLCLRLAVVVLASCIAAAAKGDSSSKAITLPPEKANPVTIAHFDSAPTIDGRLDEDVWKTASVLKDFVQIQPGDNVAPTKPTEVLLGYDAKHLYIGFRAFDEKDKTRAPVANRDD